MKKTAGVFEKSVEFSPMNDGLAQALDCYPVVVGSS